MYSEDITQNAELVVSALTGKIKINTKLGIVYKKPQLIQGKRNTIIDQAKF
jgi:hypothetical protein